MVQYLAHGEAVVGWLTCQTINPAAKVRPPDTARWRAAFFGGFLRVNNYTELSVPVSPSHAQHALRSLRTSNIPRLSFDRSRLNGQWQGNVQIMRNSNSTIRMMVAPPSAGRKKAGWEQKTTPVTAASIALCTKQRITYFTANSYSSMKTTCLYKMTGS